MATSLRDLTLAISAEVEAAEGRQTLDVQGAEGVIENGAFLLGRLCDDGIDSRPSGPVEKTARELATACRRASGLLPDGPSRCGDLLGVTSDAVGALRHELTRADRGYIAMAACDAVWRSTAPLLAPGAYDHIPQLRRVVSWALALDRQFAAHPPEMRQLAAIDRAIPLGHPVRGRPPAEQAIESIASVASYLHRADRPPIGLRDLRGICHVGELIASVSQDGRAEHEAVRAATRCEGAWRAMRTYLANFTDGARTHNSADERLLVQLAGASEALAELNARPGTSRPCDVERLARAGHDLAAGCHQDLPNVVPTLLVPVGREPLHEGRVSEWLARKAFRADQRELTIATRLGRSVNSSTRRLAASAPIAVSPPVRALGQPLLGSIDSVPTAGVPTL